MKSEKESQESVNDIGSFMLQIHKERNQQLKEYEDVKLRFDALKTEKTLHLAWKQLHLEMLSRSLVVFTERPSRIR
jgi:hypothetical protein